MRRFNLSGSRNPFFGFESLVADPMRRAAVSLTGISLAMSIVTGKHPAGQQLSGPRNPLFQLFAAGMRTSGTERHRQSPGVETNLVTKSVAPFAVERTVILSPQV